MLNQNVIYFAIFLRIVNVLINLYFIQKIYKKYQKYGLKAILVIGLINVFSIFTLVIEIIHLITAPYAMFTQIGIIYTFLGILLGYLVLFYLDLYDDSNLNSYKVVLTTLFATLTFMVNINGVVQAFNNVNSVIGAIIYHSSLFFIAYILYSAMLTIHKMQNYASENQKKLLNYVKNYVLFGFVGYSVLQPVRTFIWSNSSDYSISEQIWVLIISAMFAIIGNVFLYLGYIKPNQPTALSPQKVDRFIILTEEGIPVFDFGFDNNRVKYDETLLSGALTAITAVLKEATNVAGDLSLIKIGDQYLIMRKINQLTGIMFTYLPTAFLNSLLSMLMQKVQNMYEFDQYNQLSESSYLEILAITKDSFGYS